MYRHLRPLLFSLDAETAHNTVLRFSRLANLGPGFLLRNLRYSDPALAQKVWGLDFANPVGLAAGMDKNAKLISFWPKIGFGFCEVGSVTALPSGGNERPRSFRLLEDEAIINRMGLNNHGANRIASRLSSATDRSPIPVGVNIAKTHDDRVMGASAVEDFRLCFKKVAPLADYVTINISCPNTTEGKTFEDPQALYDLLAAIREQRREQDLLDIPVLVKFSPPVSKRIVYDSQLEELLSIATLFRVEGIVACNTASDRLGVKTKPEILDQIGKGGLSGPPLADRANALISFVYSKTGGGLPIIGVGGINSPQAAYDKIMAGASLVQVYTGLVYHGPGLVKKINEGLVGLLKRDGFSHISEARGLKAESNVALT